MSFVSDTVLRVAAKPYRCWYCDQRITKGERHGMRVGADGGDFWVMRFHPECDQVVKFERWSEEDYEFHDPSEFRRPMTAFDPCI